MVALVSGDSLGLGLTSAATLGLLGTRGSGGHGRSGETLTVNVRTGNLVLQDRDEFLASRGVSTATVRTYNSRGLHSDHNADNWTLGFEGRRLQLTGTFGAAGSSIVRTDRDGAQSLYTVQGDGSYRTTDGDGAHDRIVADPGAGQWVWIDGDTGVEERHVIGNGRLAQIRDRSGNTLSFDYDTAGRLIRAVAANGDRTEYDYAGSNLVQVRTLLGTGDAAIAVTRVRYAYDGLDRLSTVTVDLTPDDNSIADGRTYVTTYGYDGQSTRVRSIAQSDGTLLTIAYVADGSAHRVRSVTDALGHVTRFDYDTLPGRTTVTGPLGGVTHYDHDASGRLAKITTPTGSGAAASVAFGYSAAGDVTTITDGEGRTTTYGYDDAGNRVSERNAAGGLVARTFDARNQLRTETTYTVPVTSGSGPLPPGSAPTARHVHDAGGRNLLRFVIDADGRVTEHVYDAFGQRTATLRYTDAVYDVAGLDVAFVPTEAQLLAWAGGRDRSRLERVDYTYDGRGQVRTATRYAATAADGSGIAGAGATVVQFIRDQAGLLLQTIDDDASTVHTYDGLGRLLTTTDAADVTTVTTYDDAGRQVRVQADNGLTTTSILDQAGRLVSVVQTAGAAQLGTTRYAHDADGRLRMVTDQAGARRWMLYDAAGRQVAEVDADGSLVETVHDASGRVVRTIAYATPVAVGSLVDAAGAPVDVDLADLRPALAGGDATTWFFHDDAGRLVKTVDPRGALTETVYDAASRVVAVTRHAARVATAGLDSATAETVIAATDAARDRTTRYFHDAAGRVVGELDAEGGLTTHTHDGAGRLVETIRHAVARPQALRANGTLQELTPAAAHADDVRTVRLYDGKGQLVAIVDGENHVTEREYDQRGNLVRETRDAERLAQSPAADSSLANLARRPSSADRTTRWSHDASNRLLRQTDPDGTVTEHAYDRMGNRVRTTRALGTAEARTATRRYDLQGRLVAELGGEGSALLGGNAAANEAVWAAHATRHAYDAAGRLVATTDALGHRTLHFNDDEGRLRYLVDAEGAVEERRYDTLGRLAVVVRYATRIAAAGLATLAGGAIGPALTQLVVASPVNDQRTTTVYRADGTVERITDSAGADTVFEHDAFGGETARTVALGDGRSRIELRTHDRRGLQTAWRSDGGTGVVETSAAYDAFGREIRTIDANGVPRERAYDRLGRVVTTTDGLGAGRVTTWDAFDRVLTQTDALQHTTTWVYDDAARRVTMTTPEGVRLVTEQTRHGQTSTVTDTLLRTTRFDYDRDGRLVRTTRPRPSPTAGEVVTEQSYDRAGRLVQTVDANGVHIGFEYDDVGRMLSRIVDDVPGGLRLTTRYTVDAFGRKLTVTDPNGVVTRFDHTDGGRTVTQTVDPGGLALVTRTTLDAEGRTLTVTDPRGAVTVMAYDLLGRRTEEQVLGGEGPERVRRYGYDGNGNVVWREDENHRLTRYVHDAENRVRYVVDASGGTTETTYDAEGRVVRTTRYVAPITLGGLAPQTTADAIEQRLQRTPGKDMVEARRHDHDGRLVDTVDGTGAVVRLTYDAVGNVVERRAFATAIDLAAWDGRSAPPVVADAARDRRTRYAYDALNRLVDEADAVGAVTRRSYDGNGNVVRRVAFATAIGAADALSSVSASADDRVTVQVFDAANRLTWESDPVGAVTRYAHDAVGHVIRTTRHARALTPGSDPTTVQPDAAADRVTRALYDAAGRRTHAVDALGHVTRWTYDDDPAGGFVETTTRFATAIGAGGDPRAVPSHAADRTEIREFDATGRLQRHTDAEGNVERTTYDAVGNRTSLQDRKGSLHSFAYDAAGRLAAETGPAVAVTRLVVGADGTLAAGPTVELALVTRYQYDALGNLIARTEAQGQPEQRTTQYGYDAAGRQVSVTHPEVGVYDETAAALAANGLTSEAVRAEQVMTPVTRTFYDTLGNAVANVDVAGGVSLKAYDAAGRVRYEVDALGYVTATGRNAFGDAESVTRHARRTTLADSAPAAAAQVPSLAAVAAGIVADAADRRIAMETDALGRTVETREPLALAYDSVTDTIVVNARRVVVHTFDAFGDLVRTRESGSPGGGPVVETHHYHDRLGQRTLSIDALGHATVRGYDAAGNLTSAIEYATPATAGSWNLELRPTFAAPSGADRHTTWQYDRLGRKTEERRVGVSYGSGSGAGTITGDLVTRYAYDAAGNLIRTTDASGANVYSTYDALGRVTAVIAPARAGAEQNQTVAPLSVFLRDAHGNVVVRTDYARGASNPAAFEGVSRGLDPRFIDDLARAGDRGFTAVGTDDADRRTFTRYDAHGRAAQVVDAEGASQHTSYTARGEVAKTWQTVTGDAGERQTLFHAYRYDKVGRLTETIVPGPLENDLDPSGTLTRTEQRYNAFGEVTATLVDGAQVSFTEYDNAGRGRRTNAVDGVETIVVHDALGRRTAELRSAGTTALPASIIDALSRTDLRRTDIVHDRLGRVVERRLPARAGDTGAVRALPQRNRATVVTSESHGFVQVEHSEGGWHWEEVWEGSNQVDLRWSSLAALGTGDVKVELEYLTAGHETGEPGSGQFTSPVARTLTRILTAGDAIDGCTLTWSEPEGSTAARGFSAAVRMTLWKQDRQGVWQRISAQPQFGDAGSTVEVELPSDPKVKTRVEFRRTGSGAPWLVVPGVDFASVRWFDASALDPGNYEYQVITKAVDETERTTARGALTLGLAPPNLFAIGGTIAFGATPGVLAWDTPPPLPDSTTAQVFHIRPAGSSGGWTTVAVASRSDLTDGVDLSALAPGDYEYELLWSDGGDGVHYAHATGTVTIVPPVPPVVVPPIGFPQVTGIAATATALRWNHVDGAASVVVEGRRAGTTDFGPLTNPITVDAGIASISVAELEPDSYEFRIVYRDTGGATLALGSGSATFHAEVPATTPLPALSSTTLARIAGYTVSPTTLSWASPAGTTTFEIRRLDAVAWSTLAVSKSGSTASVAIGALQPGDYEFRITVANGGVDLALGAGSIEIHSPVAGPTPLPSLAGTTPTRLSTFSIDSASQLSWANQLGTVRFERRAVGQTEWTSMTVSSSGISRSRVDIGGLAPGDYVFRLSYLNGSTLTAIGVGNLKVSAPPAPVEVPPQIGDTSAASVVTTFTMAWPNLTWQRPASVAGIAGRFEIRTAPSGSWSVLPILDLAAQTVDVRTLTGTFDFRVTYTKAGQVAAFGYGSMTIPTATYSGPTVNAAVALGGFSASGNVLSWAPPAAGGSRQFDVRLVGSATWTSTLAVTTGTRHSANFGTLPEGLYEYRVAYTATNGEPVAIGAGRFQSAPPTTVTANPASNIPSGSVTANASTLSWPITAGATVKFQYRDINTTLWVDVPASGLTAASGRHHFGITGVTGTYDFRIRYVDGSDRTVTLTTGRLAMSSTTSRVLSNLTQATIANVAVSGSRMTWSRPTAGGTVTLVGKLVGTSTWSAPLTVATNVPSSGKDSYDFTSLLAEPGLYDYHLVYKDAQGRETAFSRGQLDVNPVAGLVSQSSTTVGATLRRTGDRVDWVPLTGTGTVYTRKLGTTAWEAAGPGELDAATGRRYLPLQGLSGTHEYKIVYETAGKITGLTTGQITRTLSPTATTKAGTVITGITSGVDTLVWNQGPAGSTAPKLYARTAPAVWELQDPARITTSGGKHTFALPPGIPDNVTYEFLIVSSDSAGKVLALGTGTFVRRPPTQPATPLPAVSGTTATLVGGFQASAARLSWTAPSVSNAVAEFQARLVGSTTWIHAAVENDVQGRPSVDIAGQPTGTYEFRVLYRGTGATGPVLAQGASTITLHAPGPDVTPPPTLGQAVAAVTNFSATATALSWDAAAGTVAFEGRLVDGAEWGVLPVLRSGGRDRIDLAGLAPGTYEFRVAYASAPGVPSALGCGTLTVYAEVPAFTPPPELTVTTPPYTPGSVIPGVPAQYLAASTTASHPAAISLGSADLRNVLNVVPGSADPLALLRPSIKQQVDRWGNVTETNDPRHTGWKTTYRWNHDNQLVEQTRPNAEGGAAGGPVTTIVHDQLGRQIAVRDAEGHVNRQVHDAGGNLVEEVHADGGRITHRYDAFGNRVETVDAEGNHATETALRERHTTRFDHDRLGRVTRVTHGPVGVYTIDTNMVVSAPSMQNVTETFTYDGAGRKLAQTDGTGQRTVYRYDHAGRVVETTMPLGTSTQVVYDSHGRKARETDANGRTATWSTDYWGRTQVHVDIGGHRITSTYDHAGQLTHQDGTAGTTGTAPKRLRFSYDGAGQLIEIRDLALDKTSTYAYDAAGSRVLERTVQAGVTVQDNHLAYDALGRLRDIADGRVHITLDYDLNGNRTLVKTHVNVPASSGVADADTAHDSVRHFKYDAMNRQTRVDALDANGTIGPGQGHAIEYDLNGNRVRDTFHGNRVVVGGGGIAVQYLETGEAIYTDIPVTYRSEQGEVVEQYRYDGMNRLMAVVRDGVQVDHRKYDAASRVISTGPGDLPTGYAEALNQGVPQAEAIGMENRLNRYDANGRLLRQRVLESSGSPKFELEYFHHDGVGNALAYRLIENGRTTTYSSQLAQFEGDVQKRQTVAEGSTTATKTSTYDANGHLASITDSATPANNRTFVNDADGRALIVRQGDHVQRQLVVNGEVLGRYGVGIDELDPRGANNHPNFAPLAEFSFGFQPINGNYPGASPGSYTVRQGDTLQSIARGAYGDSKLWYRIADANGLAGGHQVRVGQTLTIPTVAGGIHNDADTFEPYDPSRITGDTTPALPVPGNDGGCGGVGQVLMIVVAVVVTIYTAGAAASAMGAVGGGTTFGTGLSVFAGTSGLSAGSAFAAAAVGGAAGSIASQAAGKVMGNVDHFSWQQVALSAVASGASAGIAGEYGIASTARSGLGNTLVRAATVNAMTQGAAIGLGVQEKFSWSSVAAAAVGAGVGEIAGRGVAGAFGNSPLGQFGTRFVAGLAGGATAAMAGAGRVSVQQVAVDAFGNAVGQEFVAAAGGASLAVSASQANTDEQRQMFRRFEIDDFNRTEGAARREAFFASDQIAALDGFVLDRLERRMTDPASAASLRGPDGVYRLEIRGTNTTTRAYYEGVLGDVPTQRVDVTGLRMTEAEKAEYDAQQFQEENDRRVAAGSYDRFNAMGDAFSAGRYVDLLRHITFEASAQARAQAIARSFPQPSPAAQRLNKLLNSPLGATASLAVRGLGGSQQAQDLALDVSAFGEGVLGAALGLPRPVGSAQFTLASSPRGAGDARRAYLDQKFGRSGDLQFDINVRGSRDTRLEIDRLVREGHSVGRHGARVTERAIDERAKWKKDPITGTITDYYSHQSHSVGRNSSKFVFDEALLLSESFVRASPEFHLARIHAEATGNPQFVVKGLPLEDALGSHYMNSVYGRRRVGPIGGPTEPIDFTGGTLLGVFRQSPTGWNLLTLYPKPNGD